MASTVSPPSEWPTAPTSVASIVPATSAGGWARNRSSTKLTSAGWFTKSPADEPPGASWALPGNRGSTTTYPYDATIFAKGTSFSGRPFSPWARTTTGKGPRRCRSGGRWWSRSSVAAGRARPRRWPAGPAGVDVGLLLDRGRGQAGRDPGSGTRVSGSGARGGGPAVSVARVAVEVHPPATASMAVRAPPPPDASLRSRSSPTV